MEQKKKPALLLLPNLLGPVAHHQPFLPAGVDKAVQSLDGLIAESEREGRRYLKRFDIEEMLPITLYNEHTADTEIDQLLKPITLGERWGLLSDSGLPCIADPGASLVRRARALGLKIQPFVGPSSIMLALMQSGLSGQKFYFHGYLPKEQESRRKKIQEMQRQSKLEGRTDIFIETPYRNQHLLADLIDILQDDMLLAIAWDLTLPEQGCLSQSVELWKKSPLPNLAKRNAIFLFAP